MKEVADALHEELGIPKRFKINVRNQVVSGPVYYNISFNGQVKAKFKFVNVDFSTIKSNGGWANTEKALIKGFIEHFRNLGQCD